MNDNDHYNTRQGYNLANHKTVGLKDSPYILDNIELAVGQNLPCNNERSEV